MRAVLLALCMLAFAATNAHAEIGYHEMPLSARGLITLCHFDQDKKPDIAAGGLPAECEGFLEAVVTLFQSGEVLDLLPQDRCIDLSGEIPSWRPPIINSIYTHAKDADALQSAVDFSIDAVFKDYPCKAGAADPTPGHGTRHADQK